MSKRTLDLSDALYDYLLSVSVQETDIQKQLREETAQLPMAMMQISPDQGQFMSLLVRLMAAKKIIEVGTFTGYSALSMAMALADDGKLICCDISDEWTKIGQRYWQQAGVSEKIDLRLAPAQETLEALIKLGASSSFDLAFIDADKGQYMAYYELCLQLLRPGGLLLVDNTLWGGSVIDAANNEPDTLAIREFNKTIAQDARVYINLMPIGDGLTLVLKK